MNKEQFKDILLPITSRPEIILIRSARVGVELVKLLDREWVSHVANLQPEDERQKTERELEIINNAVRIPTGPRLKVWNALASYTLSGLNWKPKSKPTINDLAYGLGLIQGMSRASGQQADDIIEEEAKEPFLFRSCPELIEPLNSDLWKEMAVDVSVAANTIQNRLTMEQEDGFLEAYRKGTRAVFKNERTFKKKKKITPYYLNFLVFEKEIRRLDTVEDIYDFFGYGMGDEHVYDLDSFRTTCSRVGIAGRKWGSKKV